MCCQSTSRIPRQECIRFSKKYVELLIYGLRSHHENQFKKNVFNIWADNESTRDLHLVGPEGYFSVGIYFTVLHLSFHQTGLCPISPSTWILVQGKQGKKNGKWWNKISSIIGIDEAIIFNCLYQFYYFLRLSFRWDFFSEDDSKKH